jgi:hypothetical protein
MKLQEITSYNLKSATILNEGWQDLTESQRVYVGRWEKELWPLLEEYTRIAEATLTADQIGAIFKGAEAQANASGDNRNALGKAGAAAGAVAKLPVDIAKKVDAKVMELGKLAKNAGPVKNADAKFAQLKKDITANNSDSKIVQGVQKISDWAKENPTKASIAVGILTAIAAFAGGPAGGAAAGLLLRSTKGLLQGEDLSTAVGKSIKTAAYGAIAGWALNGIGDWFEGLRFESLPYDKAPGLVKFDVNFTETFSGPGFSVKESIGSMIIPESQVGEFTGLLNTMKEAAASGATNDPAAINAFAELKNFAETFDKQWWLDSNEIQDSIAQLVAGENDAFLQNLTTINSGISAIAQGTASGKIDAGDVKVGGEPVQGELDLKGGSDATPVDKNFDKNQKLADFGKVGEEIDMEERFELFLAEAGEQGELPLDNPNTLGAKAKRGLGKLAKGAVSGVSKAAGKVKAGAKELGTAVSAKKLTKAWKAAGEPTDTASIMNILQDAGLSNDQISTIGQEAKVDLKPTTSAEPKADAPATDAPTSTAPTAVAKGDTKKAKDGKEYKWMGALWVDVATNKPIGIIPSMQQGLPNPKLDPIIAAAKQDPTVAKAIKAQLTQAA